MPPQRTFDSGLLKYRPVQLLLQQVVWTKRRHSAPWDLSSDYAARRSSQAFECGKNDISGFAAKKFDIS
jgi:hypothetical protein